MLSDGSEDGRPQLAGAVRADSASMDILYAMAAAWPDLRRLGADNFGADFWESLCTVTEQCRNAAGFGRRCADVGADGGGDDGPDRAAKPFCHL